MTTSNGTSYCKVDLPGTGTTIRLRFSLLERLETDVRDVISTSGRETGGILLGSIEASKTLVVEDYEPVPSRHGGGSRCYLHSDVDRGRMASAVTLWSPPAESRLRVIGFYRSNVRQTLTAGEDERKRFAQELGDVTSLFLLVEPVANGRTKLVCYMAERGQPNGVEGRLEFESGKPETAPAVEPTAGAGPRRETKAQTEPKRRGKPSWGLTWIAAIPVVVGLIWLGFFQYQILNRIRATASLGLEVQPAGTLWRVNWNRSSECLAGAARGHLRIEDGKVHKDVDLDASELENTNIFYDPTSSEIRIRLEVFGPRGDRSRAETLRVLGAVPPATSADAPAAGFGLRPADGANAADTVKELGQLIGLR